MESTREIYFFKFIMNKFIIFLKQILLNLSIKFLEREKWQKITSSYNNINWNTIKLSKNF